MYYALCIAVMYYIVLMYYINNVLGCVYNMYYVLHVTFSVSGIMHDLLHVAYSV